MSLASKLTVTELYASVQGESSWAGLPCTFIRLTGCPLRCKWCDTVYGFKGGEVKTIAEIMGLVDQCGIPLVELTGGEPLAQKNAIPLMQELVSEGYEVLIETSGAVSIKEVPEQVHIIMDLKCPDSGMSDRNLWENLQYLKNDDEIKFVVASKGDFLWAVGKIKEHQLDSHFRILLSCAWGLVKEETLVSWMLEYKVNARLNLQQHKYIWSPRTKGV